MNVVQKSKIKSGIWATISMTVGATFAFFVFQGIGYGIPYKNIPPTENLMSAAVIESTTNTEAPKYYFAKNGKIQPSVSAEAFVVGDLSTGKIILAKNQNRQFPIASVSKLMSATILEEISKPEDLVTISKRALATLGENGDFTLNEKVKVGDIFYPLLLESSNDAAEAIAEFPGRATFIEKMNEKAKDLGLASTSFMDPSGLSSGNKSTPFDLFKFTQYLRNEKPEILKMTTNRSYNNKKHVWFSNNQFLSQIGYEGGKSGYTDPAMQTVISVFSVTLGEKELHPVSIALLRSKDRYTDVINILRYLKENIYYGEEKNANIAWVKQGTLEAQLKELNSVTFSFMGDIMLARGVQNSVMKNFNGDYSVLFNKLENLHKSDIVFANLEGTASDKGTDSGNLYSFRMDPSVIPAIRGGGIDVLSVANNHVGDWGIEAYIDTLSRLKENEILYTGGGMSDNQAESPAIIEKNGIKIGFLGFSDTGPNNMKAGLEKPGILSASNPRYAEIIRNASLAVDFLVVSLHFGEEYQSDSNERQKDLAHMAVDNGAKIVVGHHPHVIQETEVYKNGYIAYSLGNFIFDQGFSAKTMEGMILGVKLKENGEMTVRKDTVKLNKVFQPDKVIVGKEEKIRFENPFVQQ